MGRLFISHSSRDDAIVRALREALGELGQDVWIDSRELRGGDPLSPEIQRAIEEAEAFAVVVSPSSLQSSWVGEEPDHAIKVQKQRGKDAYPVIPLSLDGTSSARWRSSSAASRSTSRSAALPEVLKPLAMRSSSRWASASRPTSR